MVGWTLLWAEPLPIDEVSADGIEGFWPHSLKYGLFIFVDPVPNQSEI